MAQATIRLPARLEPWRYGLVGIVAVAVITALMAGLPVERAAGFQNFLIVFASLLIEAFPFILLGALASAAIEVFVPARAFDRLASLPGPLQLPAAGLAGVAFPVCECGSVPVARRLVAKGLAPSAAITFMFAAPVLNPIVIASTFIAYRGREVMVPMLVGRPLLGLIAAMAMGWVVGRGAPRELLRNAPPEDHDHRDTSRAGAFFGHLADDFVFMGRFLVLGAAVAGLLQTLVPQSIIGSVADTPVISLLAMMALAFILSLCSESDAFVAASFVQFGGAAQLAFLVFGPLIDTKLGILYSATFKRGFFRTSILVVGAVTLAGALWFEVLFG